SYDDRLESQPDGDTLQLGRASADGRLRARLGSEISAAMWHESREFRVSGRDETDWGPTLFARWAIAPWFALDLGGTWTNSTIREPEAGQIEDRTSRAAAAFVVLMGRHMVAEAGYSYRNNDSTDAERSYTANLYFAGLTYHFGVIPPGTIPTSEVGRLSSSDEGLVGAR
ncbi:MAG TPA: hypothetical protein VN317_05625, partial [Candidatus Methanoperedens sp.]|nr:hypothetical protein [Candidatus Methanoperedens sp.]